MRFSFYVYSTVILVTLVHRNDISGSMSGLLVFDIHSILATIEWRVSDYCLYRLGELSFMFLDFFMVMVLLYLSLCQTIRWIPLCNLSQTAIRSLFLKLICTFPGAFILSPPHNKITKMFIYFLNYPCVHVFIDVKYFIVVNIPRYRTLLTVYGDVWYAPIIWIGHETILF